jgi:hypothetical protein
MVEHRTFEVFDELKRRYPDFEGRGNIFAGSKQYWRLVSQRTVEPIEPTINIPLERAADYGFAEPVWSDSVLWKALPSPSRLPHTHFKSDYLLSDAPENPALRSGEAVAGFDATVLPEFRSEAANGPALVPSPAPPVEAPLSDSSNAPATSTMTISDKMKMTMPTPPLPPTAAPGKPSIPASKKADAASPPGDEPSLLDDDLP